MWWHRHWRRAAAAAAAAAAADPTARSTLRALQVSLSLSAVGIAAYLYTSTADNKCSIAPPGSSANDWLCLLTWIVGGATVVLMVILALLMTGMLWYRGGLYKFGQLLALLAPCLAWGTVAVLVTVNGVRANQAADATNQGYRIALMAVSFATMAVLALATLLRAFERPGRIQRDELDEIEAQERADKAIAEWQQRYGLDACRAWGSIDAARAAFSQEELARYQREFSGGFRPDDGSPDDIIYVPRHPAWYGRWLLPRRVDLASAPFMPPVLDQGKLGTCTAHAAANAYRFALVKEARQEQAFMPSRLFIFYNAKHYLHREPIEYKTGVSLRAAFLSVQQYGACEERLFPYEERTLKYSPNKEAYANAQLHRRKLLPIKLFASNGVDPRTRLYYVMAALARGHPIACGLKIFKPRAERLGRGHGQGVVLNYPTPAELALEKGPDGRKVWGWHAVLLVGYDRKNHWFKFQNSWGSGWGQRGFFYTGVGYIASPKLSCDFWFFND